MENTKVISCRVPFDRYLELLKKVNDNGLNMSDYLLTKVYCEPDSEKEKIQYLESDCAEKLEEIESLNIQIDELQYEISNRSSLVIELQEKLKKQANQTNQALQDCQNQDKYIKSIEAQKSDLQKVSEKTRLDLGSKIAYLNEQIEILTKTLYEKNEEIAELQNDLSETKEMCENYAEKASKRDWSKAKEIAKLTEEFEAKEADLDKKHRQKWNDAQTKMANDLKAHKQQFQAIVVDIISNFKFGTWDDKKIIERLKNQILEKAK